MAWRFLWLQRLRRAPSSTLLLHSSRPTLPSLPTYSPKHMVPADLRSPNSFECCRILSRGLSSGLVNLVITDGKPNFEIQERDPPKKHKWMTKKRLKMQRKREKRKRREANKRDPRCIRPKGQKKKKQKFPTAEDRIKYKIEKAKLKEALLLEKLKRYEVALVQGPNPKEDALSGEEKFYMKKMAQKRSNYVPIGRRGIFGGVILNMHLHWKKHETVKVVCKPCKSGQVHEYAKELARLSGGLPIEIIGKDTIIFYRGKNYVQPEVMSPVDTLSKKRALEKSKYEQSLETVQRFIAVAEKELELYYRHIALYGNPNTRNSDFVYGSDKKGIPKMENFGPRLAAGGNAPGCTRTLSEPCSEISSSDEDFSADEDDSEDNCLSGTALDSDYENLIDTEADSDDQSPLHFEVDSHDDLGETKVDFGDEFLESQFDSGNECEFSHSSHVG